MANEGHAPVGVAVVGAGYWGPNLVRNFLNSRDADLRWIVDLDLAKAEKLAGSRSDVRVSADLDEVLADDGVEGVAIATPPGSHLPLAMRCLEAGRHVLVEKPLATTAADGKRIVDAGEERGLVVMCDHTFCYTPTVAALRELVHSGRLGDLYYVDSIRANLGLVQSDVDVFWDLAPHDLSIIDFVLPDSARPVAVSAHGADPIGAGQRCVGYLTMPLSNGAIAHVTVNWLSPGKIRQTVFAGSKQMAVWDDMKPFQRLAIVDRGVEVQPLVGDEREQLFVSYRMGDMLYPALQENVEALGGVVGEFAASIREGRAPLTDGHAGVRILEILEAGTKSLDSNGESVPIVHA
ncbi:MAG TPA: Gfo/Idh/MocA family oxidoreductase [Microthrixaceae bacterium]|nr:Gfo/Idh/MocA family oxidoreductase [Microthrixaceae bacterium]